MRLMCGCRCRYDPFRGFLRTLDTYIIESFASTDHIFVILFSWFLSGLTGLIQRGGGAQGLADAIVGFAKTRRSTMLVAFVCGIMIFFDDYANTLVRDPLPHQLPARPLGVVSCVHFANWSPPNGTYRNEMRATCLGLVGFSPQAQGPVVGLQMGRTQWQSEGGIGMCWSLGVLVLLGVLTRSPSCVLPSLA